MRRRLPFLIVLAVALLPTVTFADPPANFLTNGSFESGFTGWKVSNKAGDKIICNGTPAALNGVCVLKIKGGGVGLKLTQSANTSDIAELNEVLECNAVSIDPAYPFLSTNASAKWPQVILTLKYTYGYTDYVITAKLQPSVSILIGSWGIPSIPDIVLPQLSEVSSMKLQIRDKSSSGVMYADNIRIGWVLGAPGIC
jgi:hypothetical protein